MKQFANEKLQIEGHLVFYKMAISEFYSFEFLAPKLQLNLFFRKFNLF